MYEDFCQAMEDPESGITHHKEGLKAMSHDARFSVLECAHFRNTQEIQHPILNWVFHGQKLRHETRVKNPKRQIS